MEIAVMDKNKTISQPENIEKEKKDSSSKHMKILVIDDNEQTTTMLSKFFGAKGCHTTVTNDPVEGLGFIREQQFDVILLDVSMPVISGMGVIELLAGEGNLHKQNIFIFSGASIPSIQLKNLLRKDGVNGFLKKPMDLDELFEAITS